MLPAKVILDARFHEKMPAKLAASTGLDALAQALESIWAVGASSESVAYATDAGRVIVRHLVPSVIEGRVDSRRRMMQAAHEAGRAINISKTTASHALSYAMTTLFGLPHGLAVALTLGELTAFNAGVTSADCLDPRGPDVVQSRVRRAAALLGATPGTLGDALRGLLRQLGVPATLEEAGVPERALDELAGAVDAVRLTNNPRRATHDELVGLLRRSWRPT
jgi:alcohol dehydrogenase class IV